MDKEQELGALGERESEDGNGLSVSVEEVATRVANKAAQEASERTGQAILNQLEMTKRSVGRKSKSVIDTVVKPDSLSRLFPKAGEDIVVKKRTGESGNYRTVVVGQYSSQEVFASKTIEGFLLRHIVPKKGGGTYVIALIGPDGSVKSETSYEMDSEESPLARQVEAGGSVEKDLWALLGALKNKSAVHDERSETVKVLQQAILNQANQNNQSQNNQNQNPNNQSNEALKLVLDRLERLERKDDDSAEKMILTKLLSRLDKADQPVALPPLPPPAPVVDVGHAVSSALEKVLDRFGQMQANQQQNQMTIKDVFEMINITKPVPLPVPPKEKGVFEQMMEFAQVKQTLFGDKDGQVEMLKQQNDHLKDELREVKQMLREPSDPLDQIKHVVELNDALEQLGRRRRGGEGMASMVKDIFGGVTDMARETSKVLDKQKALVQTNAKVQQQQVKSPVAPPAEKPTWPYPAGFRSYFDEVKNANGDLSRISATIKAFKYLADTSLSWTPHYEKAYGLLKEDQQEKAITYLRAFLNNLGKTGEISATQISSILTAFERNWDAIRAQLFGETMPEEEQEEQQDEQEEQESVPEPEDTADDDGMAYVEGTSVVTATEDPPDAA